jgi:hypothetical protein
VQLQEVQINLPVKLNKIPCTSQSQAGAKQTRLAEFEASSTTNHVDPRSNMNDFVMPVSTQ